MLIHEGSPTPGGGSLWTNLRDISIQLDFWLYQTNKSNFFLTKRESKLLKLAPCPHKPALKFSPIVKRWILSRRVTNIIDFDVFSGLTQKDLHCVPIKTV